MLGFVHTHVTTCVQGGSGGRAHSVNAPPPAPPVGTKRHPHKQQQLIRVPLAGARRRGPSRYHKGRGAEGAVPTSVEGWVGVEPPTFYPPIIYYRLPRSW